MIRGWDQQSAALIPIILNAAIEATTGNVSLILVTSTMTMTPPPTTAAVQQQQNNSNNTSAAAAATLPATLNITWTITNEDDENDDTATVAVNNNTTNSALPDDYAINNNFTISRMGNSCTSDNHAANDTETVVNPKQRTMRCEIEASTTTTHEGEKGGFDAMVRCWSFNTLLPAGETLMCGRVVRDDHNNNRTLGPRT